MRRCAAVLAVALFAGIPPAASDASTIVGNPLTSPNGGYIGTADAVFVQVAFSDPTARLTSPVDGTVVHWSLRGTSINLDPNTFRLRVLRPVGGGTFIGVGTSAPCRPRTPGQTTISSGSSTQSCRSARVTTSV